MLDVGELNTSLPRRSKRSLVVFGLLLVDVVAVDVVAGGAD